MRRHKLLYMLIVTSFMGWPLFCFFQYAVQEADCWYSDCEQASEMLVSSCGRDTSRDTIVPVSNGKVLLVSAFWDERLSPRTLRIIGIAHRSGLPRLFCHICSGPSISSVRAKVLIHSDHFGFPYGTADFLCRLPEKAGLARKVSVSDQKLPNLSGPFLGVQNINRNTTVPFPRQFTVCVSTLFGNYSNILQFVQSMEMYRILGVERVLVYKSGSGPQLQKVLEHYSAEGLLEVVPWDIDRHLRVSNSWKPSLGPGDLHYHGQIAALNDCLYRNMAISAFVVLLDIDEVIVPRVHNSWGAMIRSLSHRHLGVESFSFENAVFRSEVFGDGGRFALWPHIPGRNILQHVQREPLRLLAFNARKLIVNPRAVVWTSVHHVLWLQGAALAVPGSVARLHHCRSQDDTSVRVDQLVRDTLLWKYSAPLIKNVNRTLSRVFGT